MKNSKLYCCYSVPLRNFLSENSIRYELCAKNPNSNILNGKVRNPTGFRQWVVHCGYMLKKMLPIGVLSFKRYIAPYLKGEPKVEFTYQVNVQM